MRVAETSGRTVDEAIGRALNQLGLRRDQVDVDVITEGKAGFLGFGSEDAIVRVTAKDSVLTTGGGRPRGGRGGRGGQGGGQGGGRGGDRQRQPEVARPRDNDDDDIEDDDDAPPARDQDDAPRDGEGAESADGGERRRRGRRGGRGRRGRGGAGEGGENGEQQPEGGEQAPQAAPAAAAASRGERADRGERSDRGERNDRGDRGGRGGRGGRGARDERPRMPRERGYSVPVNEEVRIPDAPDEAPVGPVGEYADELDLAGTTLRDLLNLLGLPHTAISARDAETPGDGLGLVAQVIEVFGEDDDTSDELGLLIGRRGETLASLQYLINTVVARTGDDAPVYGIDIEGYRRRREQTLVDLAREVAEEVRDTGDVITLEPMPASERRIVHLALEQEPGVRTESVGSGDRRQVEVLPADEG